MICNFEDYLLIVSQLSNYNSGREQVYVHGIHSNYKKRQTNYNSLTICDFLETSRIGNKNYAKF